MTYTITINKQYNSKEIVFDSKPSEAVREALKGLKFRWNRKKSCWYGFAEENEIKKAIDGNTDILNEFGGVVSDGYMGANRWDGNKSHQFLYGAELTAALRADAKRIGLKGITFKSHTYSGGQSITATIKTTDADYKPFEEVKKEYLLDALNCYWLVTADGTEKHRDSFESWNCPEFIEAQELTAKHIYDRECSDGFAVNHYYLEKYPAFSESLAERLELLNKLFMTYRYDDSNGMVDYFDTNFYYDIEIKKQA